LAIVTSHKLILKLFATAVLALILEFSMGSTNNMEDINNPQRKPSAKLGNNDTQTGAEMSANEGDIVFNVEGNDETNRSEDCTTLGNDQHDYLNRPCSTEHLGKHRQYWRDMILGVNDGLVSTFLLVAGVSGGGLSAVAILLTGIAGGVAGAISMAGESISLVYLRFWCEVLCIS
jgi:hypothetical protein